MSHETLQDSSQLDTSIGLLHATRLARAMKRKKLVSHILERNEAESRVERIPFTENGKMHTLEVEVSLALYKGITNIILHEREALIAAGFPHTAEYIAPQNPEKKEAKVIFTPEMINETA